MKIRFLQHFALLASCLLLLPGKAPGEAFADTARVKALYDSVHAHYKNDYPGTIFFLDSIQRYTLSRCAVNEYFLALKWAMQCAQDHHQLDQLHHYLDVGQEALAGLEHDLGPAKQGLEADLKAFWASYYFKIASYQKAIRAHEELIEALKRKDSLTVRDRELIARSCQYLGTIQKLRGDYQDAIPYFWASLDYVKEMWASYEAMGRIAFTYQQIGKCYEGMGNDRQALWYNNLAQESLKKAGHNYQEGADPGARLRLKKNLITTYNSIAAFYLAREDGAKALQYLEKSLSYHVKDDTYLKSTAHLLGEVHALAGRYDTALYYYQLALKEKTEDYGPRNYSTALTYMAIGQLYARQDGYEKAVCYYDTAIGILSTRPELLEALEEVDWNTIFAERALINVLGAKASALSESFQARQDSAYLREAWASSRAAIKLVEQLRIDYNSEEDKQFLLKDCYPIFETAMYAGYRLGPDRYPALFEIAEKSKALLLVDWHRNLNALQRANIPDSLLQLERLYKGDVSIIEGLIAEENSKAESNLEEIRNLYQKLASARKKYDGLMALFEEEYHLGGPAREKGYSGLLPFLQKKLLKKEQCLAEYFLGDEHLFVLTVDREAIHANHIPLDFPIADWARQFRSGIYDYHLSPAPTAELFRHTQNQYATYGWKLYQALVSPIKGHLRREVVIIPDGVLGYLPFEALLTEPASNLSGDFAAYPYLLKQHQVSYCYSASLLKAMKEKQYRSSGLLAFAPAFPRTRTAAALPIAMLRSEIDTLYYNIEEVKTIRSILKGGNIQTGPQASKQAFLDLAPRYKVIHIASHGILNDSVSSQSYIAFYGGEDRMAEHNLLVRDLYPLRLEAELVTLSACETGLGALRRGEGIISLARGFAYAGAKSILTTFWAVNDQSTTEVMGRFYRHLKKGESKDAALHRAKAEYISSQADPFEAHPFYWASYIVIGDMVPLYGRSWGWWIALGLLSGSLLYWFARRRRLGLEQKR
ncbi:MAG: CHAT domain-containing protein [Phaeodactylibacter sp.]|nr:CHAT domain-containing protein [Phaeodactylibacter sp.]